MMVNGEKRLPDGWILKTVGELYYVVGGGTPSTAVPEYWEGDIPWITSADIAGLKEIQPRKQITEKAIANSATNLVPAGSLIVVTRVSLGKVALTSYPLCFSQDSQALIVKDGNVLPEYALYYLAQATQIFRYQGRGTTISGVTKKQLKELPFPLPPLPEQERIVAKIEELFTQLEAGTSALESVRAGLRRYKASVLKAAVEGRLVNGHSEIGGGELPEGWRWALLEEISSDANYGTSQKCDYVPTEFPVVRIPNIVSGSIDLNDLKYAIDGSSLREKDSLELGDLLIIRTNGSKDLIGKSAIIRQKLDSPLYFASYLIRYKIVDHKNVGAWISTIWDSPFIRAELERMVATTAGQYNLNIAKLNKLKIPLPPVEEQRRIVAEVERRLSVARQVESAVEEALVRASRLRQTVLRSAFEGQL